MTISKTQLKKLQYTLDEVIPEALHYATENAPSMTNVSKLETHALVTINLIEFMGDRIGILLKFEPLPDHTDHCRAKMYFEMNMRGEMNLATLEICREDMHVQGDGYTVGHIIDLRQKPAKKKKQKPAKDIKLKAGEVYGVKGLGAIHADYYLDKGVSSLWQARELERIKQGKYQALNAAVWKGCEKLLNADSFAAMKLQYPHAAKSDPTNIAYTPDPEHGCNDRQVVTRAGKYFTQFTSDERLVQRLAEAHRLGKLPDPVKMQLAINDGGDRSEIFTQVYDRCPWGACMSNDIGEYQSEDYHPVDAYGPEIACAYIEQENTVIARAICNTETKQYARIYGSEDGKNLLTASFADAGYLLHGGCLENARMYRIPIGDSFVMPYTDGSCYGVFDDGEWLWLSTENTLLPANGKILRRTSGETQYTHGLCGEIERCQHCGEPLGQDEDTIEVYNGGTYHAEDCADDLCFSNHDDVYFLPSYVVWSDIENDYLRSSIATQITAGDHFGDCALNHNIRTLHDGTKVHCSDPNLIQLSSGLMALKTDSNLTELHDGRFALKDTCEYIDELSGWVLTGSYFNGQNLTTCDEAYLYRLYYRGNFNPEVSSFAVSEVFTRPVKGSKALKTIAAELWHTNRVYYYSDLRTFRLRTATWEREIRVPHAVTNQR